MKNQELYYKSQTYLKKLCEDISERCVGSKGNRLAAQFFDKEISSHGWKTETPEFDAIDWINGGAKLKADGKDFKVLVSPYSLGCDIQTQLVSASTIPELEKLDAKGKIIFLHGEVTKEQLMPKNFVFYNPEEHQEIISLLEKSGAKAVICATERNATSAGGMYPFPLIEDGDFNIPSVFMTEEEGKKLLPFVGKQVALKSISERVPGKGYNVVAKTGENNAKRIVITAHIDAKKGSPGAIDNATGVIVLLLVADLLKDYSGGNQIEIVALNGEDYYAVPGQMNYLKANQGKFDNILLNINIDGAGYIEGKTAFSFFGLPKEIKKVTNEVLKQYKGIVEGVPWPQGDHSMFVQQGRPAIAVSSKWFTENIEAQSITHTPKDNPKIVDCRKLVEIAEALQLLILKLE